MNVTMYPIALQTTLYSYNTNVMNNLMEEEMILLECVYIVQRITYKSF